MCYASCDVVSWNPDYLGPAALNRAWTLVNDVRDGARRERLAAVAGDLLILGVAGTALVALGSALKRNV